MVMKKAFVSYNEINLINTIQELEKMRFKDDFKEIIINKNTNPNEIKILLFNLS